MSGTTSNFHRFVFFSLFCCGVAMICACQPPSKTESVQATASPPRTTGQQRSTALNKAATYVDDRLCADCHSEIYQSYQQVAMSKSFYNLDSKTLVEDFKDNHFYHAPSNNHYEMTFEDDQLWMTRYKVRDDGSKQHVHKQNANYVVGSGNHVRTYLSRNEVGEMYQLPVVWYAQDAKWGMAPGYDRPDHLDFSRPITRQCMFCHNAYPDFEPGSDAFGQPHRFPEIMPQGIGCQRCHGPGSQHVKVSNELDPQKTSDLKRICESIVNTGKLGAQQQDDVCFQCHLQPMSQRTSIVRKFGKGDYEYSAGDQLDEFMTFFEPARDNMRADHFEINHHPYRLRQSKCFTKTPEGIRCTDCHDPHRKIAKEKQPEFYRQKCLSCHQSDDCLDLERGRKADANCVACHMPERRTTDVVNVTMTDHKITRKPESDLTAPAAEIDVPIDMPIRSYTTSKTPPPFHKQEIYQYFARALDDDDSTFDLMEKELLRLDEPPLEPRLQLLQKRIEQRNYESAKTLSETLAQSDQQPNSLRVNFGLSLLGQGKAEEGIKQLLSASRTTPDEATTWYNLGNAYNRQGENQRAIDCLRQAINLRPNYVKPLVKLGNILALNDEFSEASEYFGTAIQYDARNIEAYQKLSAIHRRKNNWNEALLLIDDALAIAPSNPKLLSERALGHLELQNKQFRNPSEALSSAEKLFDADQQDVSSALILALATVETGNPKKALQVLSNFVAAGKRKAEIGLIFAIAQKKLKSGPSAEANFTGAKQALSASNRDRISRVILKHAESYFLVDDKNSRQE